MKRLLVGSLGLIPVCVLGVALDACGGDGAVTKDGGGDGTLPGDDGSMGMDTSMPPMDGSMMDGTTMDGTTMDGGGGGGPNPGLVNCGMSLLCDAGQNGCCVRIDGGMPSYACVPFGGCAPPADRWYCDERADCTNNQLCCISTIQGVAKTCQAFCGTSVRACKSPADCVDGGPCNTYTCPNNIPIQACTKPGNCN